MHRIALVTVMLLPLAVSGCGTAIKRGFGEVVGASAAVDWTVRPAPSPSSLQGIRGLAVGEVTNTVGNTCPPAAVAAVKPALREAFAEISETYPGGGPTVTADVVIQWYKTGGALSTLIGPESWFVWLVKFQASEGTAPPDVVVVARSEAARTSDADLARAGARALAKALREMKTKAEKAE